MTWKYISPELVTEIREYIKEDDLTIKEFAELMGCCYNTLHNILADVTPLLVKYAVRISILTGIDYSYILENSAFSQYGKQGGLPATLLTLK